MTYSRPSILRPRALLALTSMLPLACVMPPAGEESSTDTETSGDSNTTAPVEPDEWDELLEPVAGSRLRPRFRVGEDGTRAQIGWYDTLLEMPCEFREVSGAGLRCVTSTYGDDPWLYADSNCSEPVIQDIWIPEGTSVVFAYGDGCFDQRYYEIGEPVGEIYYNANGPCEFFSNDPSHRVVAIPNDQFVSATLTPQEGNSRIVPLLLEADDGARQIVGAWDREHEEEVAAAPDAADALRWFGRWEPRVSTIYYADAGCTERVALAECIPGSEQPRTARETEPAPCLELTGHHELTEEIGLALYVLRDDGTCEASGLDGYYGLRAWRVGAPLADAAYAEASVVEDGGERLRHDVHGSPEGEPFLSSMAFHDRLLGDTECMWRDPALYLAEPPTGTLDCVPREGASLTNRYLDSDCTERTAERWVFEESCPGEALYAYGGGVVALLDGPSGVGGYMLDDAESCVPAPPYEEPGGGGEGERYVIDGDSLREAAHATDVVE
jgi:hypothetical protein